MQYIPYPTYPHSEPNEEHLAVQDRRRLDAAGGLSDIDQSVAAEKDEEIDVSSDKEPLSKDDVRKFEELFHSVLKHVPNYLIVAGSFISHGYEPAKYEMAHEEYGKQQVPISSKEARALIQDWMLHGGDLEKIGQYTNYAQKSVPMLREALKVATYFQDKIQTSTKWSDVQQEPQFPLMQENIRKMTNDLKSLQEEVTGNWESIMKVAVEAFESNEKVKLLKYVIEEVPTKYTTRTTLNPPVDHSGMMPIYTTRTLQ